jgi:hypothetical protein
MSTINNIKQAISMDITAAVRRMAVAYNITEPDQLAQELLVHLGVVERDGVPLTVPVVTVAATAAAAAEAEDSKKVRARTVSAKQKAPVLEQFPDTADKKAMETLLKGYKAASQEEIDSLMTTDSKGNAFLLYVQKVRSAPAEVVEAPAPEPVKKQKKGPSQKVATRVKFNATELKIFKKVVGEGVEVTDELKKEFTEYVNGKTDEEFAVLALEGHMRAFVDSKKQVATTVEPRGGAGHMTPSEYDAARKAEAEDDEDEDLVEFEFNEETLLKGVVSGKIFRTTTEAGDVQVGVCGQGMFKDIKI